MECCGPTERIDLLKPNITRQILFYMDTCSRCGACKDACHIYKTRPGAENLPAFRAILLRNYLRPHYSLSGRVFARAGTGSNLTDGGLAQMYDAAYSCTGCRRCMVFCPFGVDLTSLINIEKMLLVQTGKIPEDLDLLTDMAIQKGISMEAYRAVVQEQISKLEQELRELTGLPDAGIPMRLKGAKILYVSLGSKDSILLPSAVFNLAGESWTLSEYEASNFGYFLGDINRACQVAERIVNEARELGVEEVVITECGHAYRMMKHLQEAWSGQRHPFQVKSVLQLWNKYVQEKRLKVKQITTPMTYHDPCQLGRNGGIFEEPRQVIRRITSDFREMKPNREKNWCCGGGGGLVARADMEEFRNEIGFIKAQQIKATGSKIVVAPCGNCRQQLQSLNENYHLNVRIAAVSEILVENISR